jgi:hypothetical protein
VTGHASLPEVGGRALVFVWAGPVHDGRSAVVVQCPDEGDDQTVRKGRS